MLGTLPPEVGLARLRAMLGDTEVRVIGPVLTALAKLHPPDAAKILIDHLKAADPVVRAAAANGLAELKPADGVSALADAYRRGESDTTYVARAAALAGLAAYGAGPRPAVAEAPADRTGQVQSCGGAVLNSSTRDRRGRCDSAAPSGIHEVYTRVSIDQATV